MSTLLIAAALLVALPFAALLGFFLIASFDYLRNGGANATTTASNEDFNCELTGKRLTSAHSQR